MTLDEKVGMILNPFGKPKTPEFKQQSQREEKSILLEDADVRKALDIYDHIEDGGEEYVIWNIAEKSCIMPVLRPDQIQKFLQTLFLTRDKERVSAYITGRYLSCLMRKSFENGGNDFILSVLDDPIDSFPNRLFSDREDKLRYKIEGQTKKTSDLRRCIATYRGNVHDYSFEECHNSELTIYGDLGDYCLTASSHCIFDIHGKIGGNNGHRMKSCTFQVRDEETYSKLLCGAFLKGKDNIVRLVADDGTIIKEEGP